MHLDSSDIVSVQCYSQSSLGPPRRCRDEGSCRTRASLLASAEGLPANLGPFKAKQDIVPEDILSLQLAGALFEDAP